MAAWQPPSVSAVPVLHMCTYKLSLVSEISTCSYGDHTGILNMIKVSLLPGADTDPLTLIYYVETV